MSGLVKRWKPLTALWLFVFSFFLSFARHAVPHVGDSFHCAAIVSGSCLHDHLCLALFDDSKGVMPIQFDRKVEHVRPNHKARVHGAIHKITKVRPVARGFRYIEMVPDTGDTPEFPPPKETLQ